MDGIHDVGGMHGFGQVPELTADGPFAEPWEGKAFVIGALSPRIAGGNLHAMPRWRRRKSRRANVGGRRPV